MTRNEVAAWLQMLLAEGVGNDAARRLLAAFGLPQQVLAWVVTAELLQDGGSCWATAKFLGNPLRQGRSSIPNPRNPTAAARRW